MQLQDDAEACRTTYEALNSQLVEELPKLLDIGLYIYTTSFNEFIKNRKRLVGRITKELLDLMDVSCKNLEYLNKNIVLKPMLWVVQFILYYAAWILLHL